MKKSFINSILIVLSVFIVSIFLPIKTNAQSLGEIGKIYTKTEANQIYGNVLESIQIDTKIVKKALNKAGNYVMFYLKNGKLKILNEKRSELYPVEGGTIDPNEILNLFSVSKVKELLTIDNRENDFTTIEIREKVLTVTSGMHTLEFSSLCPPVCF